MALPWIYKQRDTNRTAETSPIFKIRPLQKLPMGTPRNKAVGVLQVSPFATKTGVFLWVQHMVFLWLFWSQQSPKDIHSVNHIRTGHRFRFINPQSRYRLKTTRSYFWGKEDLGGRFHCKRPRIVASWFGEKSWNPRKRQQKHQQLPTGSCLES